MGRSTSSQTGFVLLGALLPEWHWLVETMHTKHEKACRRVRPRQLRNLDGSGQ
jgi:hypothetical protein